METIKILFEDALLLFIFFIVAIAIVYFWLLFTGKWSKFDKSTDEMRQELKERLSKHTDIGDTKVAKKVASPRMEEKEVDYDEYVLGTEKRDNFLLWAVFGAWVWSIFGSNKD